MARVHRQQVPRRSPPALRAPGAPPVPAPAPPVLCCLRTSASSRVPRGRHPGAPAWPLPPAPSAPTRGASARCPHVTSAGPLEGQGAAAPPRDDRRCQALQPLGHLAGARSAPRRQLLTAPRSRLRGRETAIALSRQKRVRNGRNSRIRNRPALSSSRAPPVRCPPEQRAPAVRIETASVG